MKKMILFSCVISFFFFFSGNSFSQGEEQVNEYCFIIGQTNIPSNVSITHHLSAIGTVWQYTYAAWPIYTGTDWKEASVTLTDTTTPEPSYTGDYAWAGLSLGWLNCGLDIKDNFAYGLYKIYNNYNSTYFYIDFRDRRYAGGVFNIPNWYNPDFYIRMNGNSYQYRTFNTAWTTISTGELLNVWDIKDQSAPDTEFEDYFSNCLNVTNNGSNNPRLVWGPNPEFSSAGYKIYFSYDGASYNLLSTLDSSDYSYVHDAILLGSGHTAEYYVNGYDGNITSDPTNYLEVGTSGFYKNKNSNDLPVKFNLCQNYPNPFNPTTQISFSLDKTASVSLRVYDLLGNLIKELVNEKRDVGNYTVTFNAQNLSNSIYFYRLKTENNTMTKKMIILK